MSLSCIIEVVSLSPEWALDWLANCHQEVGIIFIVPSSWWRLKSAKMAKELMNTIINISYFMSFGPVDVENHFELDKILLTHWTPWQKYQYFHTCLNEDICGNKDVWSFNKVLQKSISDGLIDGGFALAQLVACVGRLKINTWTNDDQGPWYMIYELYASLSLNSSSWQIRL